MYWFVIADVKILRAFDINVPCNVRTWVSARDELKLILGLIFLQLEPIKKVEYKHSLRMEEQTYAAEIAFKIFRSLSMLNLGIILFQNIIHFVFHHDIARHGTNFLCQFSSFLLFFLSKAINGENRRKI